MTRPIPITDEARDFTVDVDLKYGVPDEGLNEHCGQENIDWCMAPSLLSVSFRIAKKEASAIFALTFPEARRVHDDDVWLRMGIMEPTKVFDPKVYGRGSREWPFKRTQ